MRQWIPLAVVILFILAPFTARAEAPKICRNPRPGTAELAFSIPALSPGDLDRVCARRIQRAIQAGFTAVTLSPTVPFDRASGRILPAGGALPGEISRCLDKAWNAGLDVIYAPHVEDRTPGSSPIWRGYLDMKPDQSYLNVGFSEFLDWMDRRAGEIASGHQLLRISIETELERSTTHFPNPWLKITRQIRGRVKEAGLTQAVALGISPNWYPGANPSFFRCRSFGRWISSVDYIAPSMYGDWSHTELGGKQVPTRISDVMDSLTRKNHFWCRLPQFRSKPLSFGEFGIGSDLSHSEQWNQPTNVARFMRQRRIVYSNLFFWLKNQTQLAKGTVINIWAYGIHDPVGIDHSSHVIPDPAITQMMLDYHDWRCNL